MLDTLFDIDICNKKQNGVFFTKNSNIIDNLLDVVNIKTITSQKILEPSCGDGELIISLLKKCYEENNNKQFIDKVLSNVIYFNDINEKMVNQTINRINGFYYSKFNIKFSGKLNYSIIDFSIKEHCLFNSVKFDYIITNPPYITMYGRRDKKRMNNKESIT